MASYAKVSGHFIDGGGGPLAILVWDPPEGTPRDFAALYIPPFGDEMNKSRRMAALQARALAAAGGSVALLDLRGTGDSAGDHAEATWDGWRDDIVQAFTWLSRRCEGPVLLWGLRMGALLAADIVDKQRLLPAGMLLWQPIANGRGFFNQFLRLASLRQRMEGESAATDLPAPRKTLTEGNSIEVAGYDLHPDLVAGADTVDLADLAPACPVVLREAAPDGLPALTPAVAAIARRWQARGIELDAAAVRGPSFWASQEIAEAPELVAATTSAVTLRFSSQVRLAR